MANDESTTTGGTPEPEPAELHALIQISGPQEAVAALIERLARHAAITVLAEGDLALPEDAGAELARPLTATERALVQHDLRGEPRRRIAERLGVTPGTITVYRRLIRLKLRAVPPERRPLWMQSWLRRFPGLAPSSN